MISVAISTYERPELVERCLRSVLHGSERPGEIIVVDQSAGDATRRAVDVVDRGVIRYERQRPPLASRGRNRAVELTTGEYVAIVDDDCEVPPNWISAVRAELDRHRDPDVLFGAVRHPAGVPDPKEIFASIFTPDRVQEWSFPADPARLGFSAHMIVRRSSFLAVGGFDERLGPGSITYAAQDMDLNYRLLKVGCRVVTTPAIWVVHHQWRDQAELTRHYFRQHHGQAAFFAKHLRQGDRYPWRLFLRQVLLDGKLVGSALRRRSLTKAKAACSGFIGGWIGLIRGWRIFRETE